MKRLPGISASHGCRSRAAPAARGLCHCSVSSVFAGRAVPACRCSSSSASGVCHCSVSSVFATRRRRSTRRAFSLAELMIALAILGIGLLIIGAALPAGLKLTRDTVDLDTGDAAADYALEVVTGSVALRDRIIDPNTTVLALAPSLFQPRYPPQWPNTNDIGRPARGQLPFSDPNDLREPLIKVRPLPTQNIATEAGGGFAVGDVVPDPSSGALFPVWPERLIAAYLLTPAHMSYTAGQPPWGYECDPYGKAWIHPAISAADIIFPPPTSDSQRLPGTDYTVSNFATMYGADPLTPAERTRLLKSRIVWTAFYRKVSYRKAADDALYEVITIACRRPTPNHRFPLQDAVTSGNNAVGGNLAVAYHPDYNNGQPPSTLAPVPFLVSFKGWSPTLQLNVDYAPVNVANPYSDFILNPAYVAPTTLSFLASEDVGNLLPPGSIFLPARNDYQPGAYQGSMPPRRVAFVPSAPDTLPIYEVVERVWDEASQNFQIIVKNNGYYPWLDSSIAGPDAWPVWVIPPAFEEWVNGKPAYGNQSPILSVARKFVRLRQF